MAIGSYAIGAQPPGGAQHRAAALAAVVLSSLGRLVIVPQVQRVLDVEPVRRAVMVSSSTRIVGE